MDGITFVKVESPNRLARLARVKELVRIVHLSAFGECQPEGKTSSSSIAEALNLPSMLVKHILDRLAQERLIHVVTDVNWERHVLQIFPELRRRLGA